MRTRAVTAAIIQAIAAASLVGACGLLPAEPSNEIGGLTVSEAIAQRDAGELDSRPITLVGYWSNPSVLHSCPAPMGQPGELELYCSDGDYGITERSEPVMTVVSRGNEISATRTTGPFLTPWIPEAIAREIFIAPPTGQDWPPIPIAVVGHFDDPRAARCRPEAVQICRERFVVDGLVSFAPGFLP